MGHRPTPDDDPRYGRFGLRTDCARCGTQVPVNGLIHQVDCGDCGDTTTVPHTLFLDLLKRFESEFPKLTEAGVVIRGDTTWRWTAKAVPAPPCPGCGEALDGTAEPGDQQCAACSTTWTVRDIPDGTRKKVAAAVRVFGEDSGRRPQDHTDPVALSCPQCGGGLTLGPERSRVTPCDFCSVQVHIPDAVWRQLHPPRQVREWVVRFEGETQASKLAKKRQAERERKQERKKERAEREAEKRRQKAEAEERRRAAQSARDKKRHQETVRRQRIGMAGTALAFGITLPACAFAALAVLAYAMPWVFKSIGLGGAIGALLGPALLVVAGVGLAIAWVVGHVTAAYSAGFPIGSTMLFSLIQLVAAILPGVGLFGGLVVGLFCLAGRFPTPPGEELKNFKHERFASWPLAVLYPAIGAFSTVAAAVTLNMTVLELIQAFGD